MDKKTKLTIAIATGVTCAISYLQGFYAGKYIGYAKGEADGYNNGYMNGKLRQAVDTFNGLNLFRTGSKATKES
jgi:hypothetical protein